MDIENQRFSSFKNIDIELWKYIQEKFAEVIGLPIHTIDSKGNEIVVCGKIPFYCQLIRNKRPELFYKFNGLVNITKPLMLYGEQIGSVVCGPVGVDNGFDFKELAERLGIEESELIDAANEIKPLQKEKIELCDKILSLLADTIPRLAYQKQKRDKQIAELTALYKIIRKVNSTLELDKVLKYIMNFLVNSLNSTNCSVLVYGEDGGKRYFLKEEAKEIAELEERVSSKVMKEGRIVISKDSSILCIPLKLKEEVIGTINLYGGSADKIKEDEIEFISVIADQVAMAIANAQRFEQVKELAVIDKLTNTFNRRYFMELLQRELEAGTAGHLSLVLIDIDDFGMYNNIHGHPKGDQLLKGLSGLLKLNVRAGDMVGRYGGEEFIILLPGTKPAQAAEIAERLRKAIEEQHFEGEERQPEGKLTISLGLVTCLDKAVSQEELIKEVDSALYKAKSAGKNRLVKRVLIRKNLKTDIS